jgi:hypothetical protein
LSSCANNFVSNKHVGQIKAPGFTSGECEPHKYQRIAYARGCASVDCEDHSGFAAAVSAAQQADAVIVTLGLDQSLEREVRCFIAGKVAKKRVSLYENRKRTHSERLGYGSAVHRVAGWTVRASEPNSKGASEATTNLALVTYFRCIPLLV